MNRFRSWLGFAASLLLTGVVAHAADVSPAVPAGAAAPAADAKGAVQSPESLIKARVQQHIGGKVSSVRKMPFGLYEVVVDDEVVYVDEGVDYLFAGRVIDVASREDLTSARRDEVLRIDFKSLPLDHAVKSVHGDGSRVLVIFADPNCPYCKRLEKELVDMKNTTFYTFLYPILSDDSVVRAKGIWCSPDRAAAWNALMLNGKVPGKAAADCKNPIDDNLALGHRLSVSATPTIVYADGRRMPGAVPIERIEATLADLGKHSANPDGAANPPADAMK